MRMGETRRLLEALARFLPSLKRSLCLALLRRSRGRRERGKQSRDERLQVFCRSRALLIHDIFVPVWFLLFRISTTARKKAR